MRAFILLVALVMTCGSVSAQAAPGCFDGSGAASCEKSQLVEKWIAKGKLVRPAAPEDTLRTLPDPCSFSWITVYAFEGAIDVTGRGAMQLHCATWDDQAGDVTLQGVGFERVRDIELNSMFNEYYLHVPFAASPDGSSLVIHARAAICAGRSAGYSYTPYITYLAIDSGYFAIIGSAYTVQCS